MLAFSVLFRAVLLVVEHEQLRAIPFLEAPWLILEAFFVGMRFDTVIIAFALILPAAAMCVGEYSRRSAAAVRTISASALSISFAAIATVYCLDLAYFAYNGSRITLAIFQWNANPGIVLSMIFEDAQYSVLLVCLTVMCILFGIYSWRHITRSLRTLPLTTPRYWQVISGVLFAFLLVSGMRGSLFKGPVRQGDATISQYQFPNQLAINPAFVLYRDMRNSVDLMEDSAALRCVQRYLGAGHHPISPIARAVKGSAHPQKFNVVLILMESMTADNMSYFGNTLQLTPHLDSLARQSLFFENAYSSGIHTNNGIFTALFSFPSFWRLRPLSPVRINEFSGFSGVLKQHGYRTAFLTTQDASFDNVSQFMPRNHFDTIISQAHYPKDQIVNTFGVPDHVQFDKSIAFLDEQWTDSVPFFACILTASNHPPIVIPEEHGFAPTHSSPELGVIQYADWSIGRFMEMAQKTDWYSRTVFVFVADHGAKTYPSPYDLILSFNHVPMIIHSPGLPVRPAVNSSPCGQIDAFPVVMGLLGLPYLNNTFGCDVVSAPRPYTFFSADDKIACLDREYVYVFRKSKSESLYRYSTGDLTDYISIYPAKADSMRIYCKANIQAAQWCITADKTGCYEN